MDLKATPALAGAELSVGDVLQVATHDAVCAIDGTAAFVILQLYPADVIGRCIEAECIGCQQTGHLVTLSMLFPGQGVAPRAGILHLCAGDRLACHALAPSRTILHVDTLRRRKKELIHEAWICVLGGPEPVQAEPDGAGLKLASDGEARLAAEMAQLQAKADRGEATLSERIALAEYAKRGRRRSRDRRRKRSRSRRRRRRGSSSSSSASGVSHGSLFREAPGRGGSLRNEIRTLAGRQPGRLYQSSLRAADT